MDGELAARSRWIIHNAWRLEQSWNVSVKMRDEEMADAAINERKVGMKKRWQVRDVSKIKGGSQGGGAGSYLRLYGWLLLCYGGLLSRDTASMKEEGGAIYKSMSWSTSIRERAKLGRLDSEPPLLLREWPPETGRRDKGRGTRRVRANRGGVGGEAREWESQQARKAVKQEGGRRRKKKNFTQLQL